MITDVFSSNKSIEVRFNGGISERYYTLKRKSDKCPYRTEEIDVDDEDGYDQSDLYFPYGYSKCGFRFCRSFDFHVEKDAEIVICFNTKPNAKNESISCKIEIKGGEIYTNDGYISTPLTEEINFKVDDRKIICKKINNELWLCFKSKL